MRTPIATSLLAAACLAESEPLITILEPFPEILRPFDPLPPSKETHFCHSSNGKPCNPESHYFNGLACMCFAQYQCEIGCPPETSLAPFDTCGSCDPDDKIRGLYPQWATDKDIMQSAIDGMKMHSARPDDWRICPRAEKCDERAYWDELACSCFYEMGCQCPVGRRTDPGVDCGKCMTEEQIWMQYYPKWATPMDVSLARLDGLAKKESQQYKESCPFDKNQAKCQDGQFWNELACQCHYMASCRIMCQPGEQLSPLSMCNCINIEELKNKIYPEWATDDQIRQASRDGYTNYEHWRQKEQHECKEEVECSSDFYFNELACKCFSLAQCFVGCEFYNMPTEHCGCTSDEKEYLSLFPSWASDQDIEESVIEGMTKEEKVWPNGLVRPTHWPQCKVKDDCRNDGKYLNELSCSCMSLVQCEMECYPGTWLDPAHGCSCVGMDEFRHYFPDWSTDKDIDHSFLLASMPMILHVKQNYSGNWPMCNPVAMCSQGYYWNELTCSCWAEYSIEPCAIRCSSFIDPRTQCGCLMPEDFYSLFPSWATKKDIERSVVAMSWPVGEEPGSDPKPLPLPTPEPQPALLVRPNHWPECERAEPCGERGLNPYFNELACRCMTNLMCKIWCGADEGMTLNPVDGCSCITIEEEQALYPKWATAKDRDYAIRLGQQNQATTTIQKTNDHVDYEDDQIFNDPDLSWDKADQERGEDTSASDILDGSPFSQDSAFAMSSQLTISALSLAAMANY